MSTSLVNADSVLAIDVGSITTRAALFDVVDGRYRFLASGSAPTTANAPYSDVGEGVGMAIDSLQAITGRVLFGPDETLIVPTRTDGSGVDKIVATLSAGPPLSVIVVGLLEDVSLGSARRLASTTYAQVVDSIGLNDRRKPSDRVDSILRLRPDVVVAAGGTDGGASQSVLKLLETVGLASYMMPRDQRPEVLFTGNEDLRENVTEILGKIVSLHFAPNVRPTLDVEQLAVTQMELANIYRAVRARKLSGVLELDRWTRGKLLPSAVGFGRVVRFLSKIYDSNKGVMGVDIGATSTSVAAGFSGDLVMGVYPQFGLGTGLDRLLEYTDIEDIRRWLYLDIPKSYLQDYLKTKAMYPASVPATRDDLDIEQALARQLLQLALRRTARGFPRETLRYGVGISPGFEPILATGSVLTRATNLAQSMLMLLDGLQPTGVTTFVLDQSQLAPVLGASAAINPVLAVQVLESSAFLNLGTVISPVGKARPDTPVLRVQMNVDDGNETSVLVKQGTMEILPLPVGQSANLKLTPLHRFDIGMGGPGRGGGLRVVGGALGVVIDARGRPLRLAKDPVSRREAFHKWRWKLGGS